jgi:hypothetical protein
MPQVETNTWTKWWWLSLYQWGGWSIEERRAGRVLWLTFVSVMILAFFFFLIELQRLHLNAAWTVAISLTAAIVLTVPSARVATDFFPAKVQVGDAAAAKRLGGLIPEIIDKPLFPSLWWLDYQSRGYYWSSEEIWTRRVIFSFALLSVLIQFVFASVFLHGINQRAVALGLLLGFALSLYVSRRFCVWIWPDYVKRADALAYERLCKTGRGRSEVAQ